MDKWSLLRLEKDGVLIGTILLDGAATPSKQIPWLVYVGLTYKGRPRPTQEEFEEFDEVDDTITALCRQTGSQNVAIVTLDGNRDWICYCPDQNGFAELVQTQLSEHGPRTEALLDPRWSQYGDLRAMVKRSERRARK